MNLLKKWRKQDNGGGADLARREGKDVGPSHWRDEFDRTFEQMLERVWRNPWEAMSDLPALSGLANWPAVDLAEDDRAVTLRVDLPGMGPEDVDVQVSGNLLTLRGARQDEWSDNGKGLRRHERRFGSFSRTITLPEYVDAEKVEARYDKGILTVTVPKAPGKGPRRVPVTSG